MVNQEDLYAYYEDEEDVVDNLEDNNEYTEDDNNADYSEDTYDTYDENEEYYDEDEYRRERRKNIIYAVLFVLVIMDAIIGTLTLIIPQVRNSLFSAFFG